MKNNFRYQVGCSQCKFCLAYGNGEYNEYYCSLDGEISMDVIEFWHSTYISEETFDSICDLIMNHVVHVNTICDDFETEEYNF